MVKMTHADRLAGKAVVVTGAGRGLGRAFAVDVAIHGAAVVVNDIDEDLAEEVAAAILREGGEASSSGHSVSVWDEAEAEALIAQCIQDHGEIDGLVNNAAYFYLVTPEMTLNETSG